jgi:hypothetical protein
MKQNGISISEVRRLLGIHDWTVHYTNLGMQDSFTYVIFGIDYMWLYFIFVV